MTTARTGTMSAGLAYSAFGDGPPVVFIRPVMPSSGNPSGLTGWAERRPLARLAEHFTIYCLSRPDGLKPGISMADLATHYADAIRDHFGQPTDLIGLSTSGSICLQLAADHPGAVRRLVVVAAACRLGDVGRQMQRAYADRLAAGHHRTASAPITPAITDSRLGQRVLAGMMLVSPRPADPEGMVAMLMAEDGFSVCGRLDRIAAPTLVIGGAEDRLYPPELVTSTANGIPDARLRLYDGRKHHTVAQDPRFTTDVLAFLSATP